MKISVIGAGGWGTTLANLLSEKNEVSLWVREKELIDVLQKERENKWFLPGVKLSPNLKFSDDVKVVDGAEAVVFAVPAQFMRATANKFSKHINKESIIVTVSKGIELSSYKRMDQVLEEELENEDIVALSGPNHCEEVSRKMPSATVVASHNPDALDRLKEAFSTGYFMVFPHDDIVGVEICGAIKNITAIASGVVDGLKLGDSSKASVITYGLTEMNKFGRFFGAKRKTIYGLAGVGDLIATCTSKHSRNRFVGEKIAEGKAFEEIKEEMKGMVAEGVMTTKAVHEFAVKNGIDMPLTALVYIFLFLKKELKKAIKDLIYLV
ncbi:MAG: NAD(P)H-dependent glycerol-3-phosphate dehydrogenase [Nanoarchaeota archaeon]